MSAKIYVTDQPVAAAFSKQQPSLGVDAALNSLQTDGGLKKTTQLSTTNMNVFRGLNIFPKDMAVNVSVQLQRGKDMELPNRVKLADEVRDTIATELQSVFRGEKEDADATVVVRILLVSDGTSKGSRWKAKNGVGLAKLTLAWFLVAAGSGEVATAKQIYLTEDCSPAASSDLDHLEYSSATVRSMARNAASQIEEVTSEVIHWKQEAVKEVEDPTLFLKQKPAHEEHDVGEDKMTILQKLMLKLTQI